MVTPVIDAVGPALLDSYQVGKPRDEQPSDIPATFLDAMDVRIPVFATEQKVPVELEFDSDDSRARHWVVYTSVNKDQVPKSLADNGTMMTQARRSSTAVPIGTVRVIPFPHPPHPLPGRRYINNVLEDAENDGVSEKQLSAGPSLKLSQTQDRKTSLHDGVEPYVKIGRLAVLKEFRGMKLASLLIDTVLNWLRENPNALGVKVSGVELPQWKGLVCAHAQTHAVALWERHGFVRDEEMGQWWEEGIPHVGMFYRVKLNNEYEPVR